MEGRYAIHSPNWLGDAVMFLPAWRAWRDAHRGAEVAVVAKRRVAALWRLVADVDELVVLDEGRGHDAAAVAALRKLRPFSAIAVPASFRSAWLLWRGGASSIRGTAGQGRFPFIRDRVSLRGLDGAHQSLEYARIMGVEDEALPPPSAALDLARLPPPGGLPPALPEGGYLAILPGAARGGSKRWPPENFAAAARMALDAGIAGSAVVCGTEGERAECDAVAKALGGRAANLCGKTGVPELAALLAGARAVLSNDSGGMHLATAVGAPVVAVFGLTDPMKTGPLGKAAVVAAEGVRHARAIPRESPEAERALRSISPERVFDALRGLLDGNRPDGGNTRNTPPASHADSSIPERAPKREDSGIAANAAVVAFMTFVSRVGGLVREVMMAHFFGAGVVKSAFDVAYRIPNLFRRLFGEGALSAALIPVYTEVAARQGRREADRLASAVAGITLAFLGAVSALGILATYAAARWLPLGDRWLEILPPLRIMLPYAPLICLAALVMGVLNSLKSFAIPALAPAFQNLCCILALGLAVPFLPAEGTLRIRVVSWSILISGAVQVAVQLPVLKRHGVPLSLAIPAPLPEGVRRVFRLMLPMALSAGVVQVNVCLDSVLAMKAGVWGPSVLGYADRIVYLPLAIFGTAFYTALLPALSSSAAAGDCRAFSTTFARTLRSVVLVMAPASFGMIALAWPVTLLIYKSGAFGKEATLQTAVALIAYSAGLIQAGVHKLALAPFYARKDSATPMAVGVAGVALNLAMNLFFIWILPERLKPVGIAIATSISSTIAACVLLALLSRRRGEDGERLFAFSQIGGVAASAIGAAAVMLFACHHVAGLIFPFCECHGLAADSKAAALAALCAAIPVGAALYFAIMRLLCPAALRELVDDLRSRRRRRAS